MNKLKDISISEKQNNLLIGAVAIVMSAVALVMAVLFASNFDLEANTKSLEINLILLVPMFIAVVIIAKRESLLRSFISFFIVNLSLFLWVVWQMTYHAGIKFDVFVLNIFIIQAIVTISASIFPSVFRRKLYSTIYGIVIVVSVDLVFVLTGATMHWVVFAASAVIGSSVVFRLQDSKQEEYNVYDSLCSAFQYY